jgi:predicted PurR-regulated permease PerM
MFALFTFGYLFGFLGLLIAVPLAGAMGVLMRFALRQYLASSLYAVHSEAREAPVAVASTPSGPQPR